ncbi:asparagine synthase-related protein [Campylobacter lanienae]|uniref:asparagine synthase-related protein n=1 Tax=Campylobacter lanienae TaxID=75658 RepID=UPI0021C1F2AC|nr:asparagine synthase C-terminal domain-containing protein [Campylobacter lanienae]
MIDKLYCMSHYLAFRFIKDENINFFDGLSHTVFKPRDEKEITPVSTIDEMDSIIRAKINEFYAPNKTAILLSGGIDSAILASYLPEGTKAYTFHCLAPNAIDERVQARKYCDIYQLDHEIVEMHWSDFEELTPEILKADGVPFHSIEVQLLKAAKYAKSQGIERFIIGESADLIFGGMDKLIGKDWNFEDFYNRYNFVEPSKALKNPISVKDVYEKYRLPNDKIDFLTFMDEIFSIESSTSYMHAFKIAGIEYLDPYTYTKMALPLDLNRVRNGEPKYMVRELFAKRYPNIKIPTKIPMPRAMNQWLKDYKTTRPEFIENCTENMTGDQKWLCWCLEQFLNMHDKGEL